MEMIQREVPAAQGKGVCHLLIRGGRRRKLNLGQVSCWSSGDLGHSILATEIESQCNVTLALDQSPWERKLGNSTSQTKAGDYRSPRRRARCTQIMASDVDRGESTPHERKAQGKLKGVSKWHLGYKEVAAHVFTNQHCTMPRFSP